MRRILAIALTLAAAPSAAQEACALFGDIATVMLSPRCANCHSADDRPRQGDASRSHIPPVRGGPEGRGVPGQLCATCHRSSNSTATGAPGAPDWRLVPPGTGWAGLSPAAACAVLKENVRVANVPLPALVTHVQRDPLILWAWEPGGRRTPPPLAHDVFVDRMTRWVALGADCPE